MYTPTVGGFYGRWHTAECGLTDSVVDDVVKKPKRVTTNAPDYVNDLYCDRLCSPAGRSRT